MADLNDDGLPGVPRAPYFLLNSSLVTGVLALALGGTNIYTTQDRFTGSQAIRLEARIQRDIDVVKDGISFHLQGHPDTELRERIRLLELALQRVETQLKAIDK